MSILSRREFLQRTTAAAAIAWVSASLAHAQTSAKQSQETLTDGWEFLRMPLADPWEVATDPPLARWSSVSLPHCFNSYDGCDPDVPAYRGKGWYRRHLKVDNPYPNGRTLLHFEGAGQSAEVYLGNALVGRHIGGYDEFVFDITEQVSHPAGQADRLLSVLCDNSPDMERMPSDLSDFTLYGGLYRSVHLVYVPPVSLEMVHVHVKAAAGKPALIQVTGRLYNPSRVAGAFPVRVAITDATGAVVYQTTTQQPVWDKAQELASFPLPSPRLWSPGSPHLYECRVTLGTGATESVQVQRFGVRFFEFQEHGPFFLNGERLLIQGTHRHEDHAGYAAAMPPELIRQEMRMIREMGANFIRLAHYQQQRLVLDLCDELGLLVWEELPWCRAGIGDAAFQQQGLEKLATMIDQHANHPSIILWGLGNEDDWDAEYPSVDHEAIRRYMQQLNQLAHTLDDTRSTSYRRCDFARDIPDIYAPSIWAGWYGGRFIDYEAALTAQHDKSPRMLHTEWGADNHARRHAEDPYKTLAGIKQADTAEKGLAYLLEGGTPRVSRDGDWSETYACDLFDWHLKVQESLPWLTGSVQWIFKDFTTPLRSENPIPRVNQKGVVERDLTKKEGYYVFQSYWSHEPMAHIYGHTWPTRWGSPGQLRTVKVYSNCASAELFLNGVSVGVRQRDSQNFPAAGLRWELLFLAGPNTLRVVAKSASGKPVTDEISFHYQTEAWGKPAQLKLHVLDTEKDKTRVEALLCDAQGVLCLDARNVVRFSLAGNGTLLDNLGTSTGSRVLQLYNGRAEILVFKPGANSTMAVTSDGLTTATCGPWQIGL